MLKNLILWPLSVLYGIGVSIRNRLFNLGILKIREFDVPIICVGNITVGGTGKTPHTESLINELKNDYRVACLSRGYKRKTSGFVLATENSTANDIGDEPMQIKNKFPEITVAVDADRVRGIKKLMQLPEKPEVIILDDGFQHRYVKADINIMLLAGNYHVSFAEAEAIKQDYARHKEILPVVRPVIEKMATIVRKYVDPSKIDTIYLCGGTTCLTGIEGIFEKVTGIHTVKPANPFLVTPAGIARNCILSEG